jgi:basic membrane protein A
MKQAWTTAVFFSLIFVSTNAFALRVGLVLDKGGKDDKSFNTAAYEGAVRAKNELKIELKVVEATDENAFESLIRAFAQKNYDLVIGIGFAQTEAIKKVSNAFPKTHFAIVDGVVDTPNTRSLLFQEHEGSFLVGAIAALTTKTQKIGFVGGMDIPLIRRFEMGYRAGMKYANPKASLVSNFVGVTPEAWVNPPRGKELAASQYAAGADIVFVAAGATNNGVFDAAEEKKKLAIGCDANQNWVKPGFILTSMLKRVDVAVYQACKDALEGKFTGGTQRFGLKDGGIDFAVDKYNEKLLTPEVLKQVNTMKADIIAGKIKVPDYYQRNAK